MLVARITAPDLPSSRLRQASPRDVHSRCSKYAWRVSSLQAKFRVLEAHTTRHAELVSASLGTISASLGTIL